MLGTYSNPFQFVAPRLGTRNVLTVLIATIIMSYLHTLIVPDGLQVAMGVSSDTSNYHSSILPISEGEESSLPIHSSSSSTPTAQAALRIPRTFQSTDIVNSKSIYEVMFTTSTTGAIDRIQMDFPAGTNINGAIVIEIVGIGAGALLKPGGSSMSYDVTAPVSIPAGKFIRLEITGIKNPSGPSALYSVTITTRDGGGNIIDGPSQTNVYTIKRIGNGEIGFGSITGDKISPSFMVSRLLQDNSVGHSFGWNPDGILTDFIIIDDTAITGSNPVLINVGDSGSNSQCESLGSLTGFFTIQCLNPPPQGSELRYTVVNLALP